MRVGLFKGRVTLRAWINCKTVGKHDVQFSFLGLISERHSDRASLNVLLSRRGHTYYYYHRHYYLQSDWLMDETLMFWYKLILVSGGPYFILNAVFQQRQQQEVGGH